MLRVLHLDTGNDLRGGQRQLIMLARGLRKRGHLQLIGCPAGRLAELARREGFETFEVRLHRRGALRSVAVLRRVVRSRGFEIVHAHDGRAQTLAWLASTGSALRRVASRRVTFAPRGRLIHRWKYSLTCDGVIAVSNFVRQLLLNAGIPPAKIEVIPDGIDFPECIAGAATRLDARRRFGLDEGDFVIGHAGAFAPEKGQEVAIQAFNLVARQIPAARLLLAGEGSRRPTLAEKYRLHNPAGPIRLVGYLDDLASFMNSLDLFLMPSLSEGLGSSALIAMAHGVPVIASQVGGLPEIVTNGDNGWLVEPGSASQLAEAILAAAGQPKQRQKAGLQAREQSRLFTNDIMVRKTEAFYERLLAG